MAHYRLGFEWFAKSKHGKNLRRVWTYQVLDATDMSGAIMVAAGELPPEVRETTTGCCWVQQAHGSVMTRTGRSITKWVAVWDARHTEHRHETEGPPS